jgi:beta-lactamase regulating signal transducer with metallopeptidase domain
MNRKKILIIIGLVGVAIGSFALTKFLTRNTRHYKYLRVDLVEFKEEPIASENIE